MDADLNISDDTRIRAAVPTLKYLVDNGAKVLLTSHLVRPMPMPLRNLIPAVNSLLRQPELIIMLVFKLLPIGMRHPVLFSLISRAPRRICFVAVLHLHAQLELRMKQHSTVPA